MGFCSQIFNREKWKKGWNKVSRVGSWYEMTFRKLQSPPFPPPTLSPPTTKRTNNLFSKVLYSTVIYCTLYSKQIYIISAHWLSWDHQSEACCRLLAAPQRQNLTLRRLWWGGQGAARPPLWRLAAPPAGNGFWAALLPASPSHQRRPGSLGGLR